MSKPIPKSIQTQTAPDQTGCPTVLVEGRPVAVLGSSADGEEIAVALPRVLAGGRPVTIVSADRNGATSVLGE